MVHLTDHMGGKTCCSLAVCAHFVQRKVILAYCELDKPYRTNMPQVVGWCLHAVARTPATRCNSVLPADFRSEGSNALLFRLFSLPPKPPLCPHPAMLNAALSKEEPRLHLEGGRR